VTVFESRAIICVHVYERSRPVLFAFVEDGELMCLCGAVHPDTADSCRVAGFNHLVEHDPTLASLPRLAERRQAERIAVGGPWVESPLDD